MSSSSSSAPLLLGVTGASGSLFAYTLLKVLHYHDIPVHLIVSDAGRITLKHEMDIPVRELEKYATATYNIKDIAAPCSSGSFMTRGMIIAPCTVHTLASVATGIHHDLLTRAADVTLKERRKLLLMVRETPLSGIHIQNMMTVTQAGGIIFPPVPALYNNPQSIQDIVDYTVYRMLDCIDIHIPNEKRWNGFA